MEKQDYDGSKNLLHRMIGSSAHAKKERADEDFYAKEYLAIVEVVKIRFNL